MKAAVFFLIVWHVRVSAQVVPRPGQPTTGDSALANRVAGCYELVRDGWQSDSGLARFATIPADPIRFELTKTPAPEWSDLSAYQDVVYYTVRSDSITRLFSSWIRLPGAPPRILVSNPLPMGGFSLRLTPRGTDLVGTISTFTDAIPPDGKTSASHAVTARRIECRERSKPF